MTVHNVGDDNARNVSVEVLLDGGQGDVVGGVHAVRGPADTRGGDLGNDALVQRAVGSVAVVGADPSVQRTGIAGAVSWDANTAASDGHGGGGHQAADLADGLAVGAHRVVAPAGGVALLVERVADPLPADGVGDVVVGVRRNVEKWVMHKITRSVSERLDEQNEVGLVANVRDVADGARGEVGGNIGECALLSFADEFDGVGQDFDGSEVEVVAITTGTVVTVVGTEECVEGLGSDESTFECDTHAGKSVGGGGHRAPLLADGGGGAVSARVHFVGAPSWIALLIVGIVEWGRSLRIDEAGSY